MLSQSEYIKKVLKILKENKLLNSSWHEIMENNNHKGYFI